MSPVRLIGPQGEQIGILPIGEAQARADDVGLDLVEVAPKSKPPVCRIMDYGKFKYELAKKDKISKKKQHRDNGTFSNDVAYKQLVAFKTQRRFNPNSKDGR